MRGGRFRYTFFWQKFLYCKQCFLHIYTSIWTTLYCTLYVLYCTVLYCTVQYSTVQYREGRLKGPCTWENTDTQLHRLRLRSKSTKNIDNQLTETLEKTGLKKFVPESDAHFASHFGASKSAKTCQETRKSAKKTKKSEKSRKVFGEKPQNLLSPHRNELNYHRSSLF